MKAVAGIMVRIILAAVLLALLVLAGGALIMKKKQRLAEAPAYKAPAVLVETAPVVCDAFEETHDYLAMVAPVESANITARVTATIEQVAVDEGDYVTPGQTLVVLDPRQNQAQQQAVAAQVKQAQAELAGNRATETALQESLAYWSREAERDSQLAQRETIPRSHAEATLDKKTEVEGKMAAARQQSGALEQRIRSLEASLEEAKTTLSYYEIQSPFEGVITARMVDPGDQAAPGKALLVVESAGAMMITFDVPQTDLAVAKPGLPVSYTVGTEKRKAKLTRIYPALNQARMARAEVILKEEEAAGLTSGEYLTATLAFAQHADVPQIPTSALIEGKGENGGAAVFVVQDGVLKMRRVRVLGAACEQAAVEGLQAGERVVVYSFLGWARLADGMKVEARQ